MGCVMSVFKDCCASCRKQFNVWWFSEPQHLENDFDIPDIKLFNPDGLNESTISGVGGHPPQIGVVTPRGSVKVHHFGDSYVFQSNCDFDNNAEIQLRSRELNVGVMLLRQIIAFSRQETGNYIAVEEFTSPLTPTMRVNQYTYAELATLIRVIWADCYRYGLVAGSVVGLAMDLDTTFLVLLVGLFCVGCTVIIFPANGLDRNRQAFQQHLNECGCTMVFTDRRHHSFVAEAGPPKLVITCVDDLCRVNPTADVDTMIASMFEPMRMGRMEGIGIAPPTPFIDPKRHPDIGNGIITMGYYGQSVSALVLCTGDPFSSETRRCILSHTNLYTALLTQSAALHMEAQSRVFTTFPHDHAFGVVSSLLLGLWQGVTHVFLSHALCNITKYQRYAALMHTAQIDVVLSYPEVFVRTLYSWVTEIVPRIKYYPVHWAALSKIVLYGGPNRIRQLEWIRRNINTSCKIFVGYGMTEMSGLTHIELVDDAKIRDVARWSHCMSVGIMIPKVECKIVDPNTRGSVETGVVGAIYLRGPQCTTGFANKRGSLSRKHLGWLDTHDIGMIAAESFSFHILNRLDECIQNKAVGLIYPGEIQNFLVSHSVDIVEDCCVLKQPIAGREKDELTAFIVLRANRRDVKPEYFLSLVKRRFDPKRHLRGGVSIVNRIDRTERGFVVVRDLLV